MISVFVVFHLMKLQQVIKRRKSRDYFSLIFFSLVGACAHLTSFYGTDTISGCVLAKQYYLAKTVAGNSIPATEHSTMTSWTRDREQHAYENFLGRKRKQKENYF